MFKPINRSTFLRDLLVINIGYMLFALSISLLVRANLGTSPWVMLEVALSKIFGLSQGTITVLDGFLILSGAVLLREQIGWGTIGNILIIGPWIDVWLGVIPPVTGNIPLQLFVLLSGIFLMGIASAIYIGVKAGAGPRDSLMLAVSRKTGWSMRRARGTIEVFVVIAGFLLGGPAGIGTIIHALLIGPSVQWGFKLFKVQPHRPAVPEGVPISQ